MALTKVAPAGIGSTPGDGYRIGSSFLHSTGVELTNANASGIVTAAQFDGKLNIGIATFTDDVKFTGDAANVTWDKSTDDLKFDDNAKAVFGASNDINIYHESSSTTNWIEGAGLIRLQTSSGNIEICPKNGAEKGARFITDGASELYYDGTKRFSTSGIGATVTGQLDVGNVNSTGVITATKFVGDIAVGSSITYADTEKAYFGTDLDLEIYHSGTKSIINDAGTGNLELQVGGSTKLTTTSTGVTITGGVSISGSSTFTGNVLDFGESKQLRFGANNDFAILHNGNTLLENDTTGGNLTINNKSTSGQLKLQVSDGEDALVATPDGAVDLYHNGTRTFATEDNGAYLYGPEGGIAQLMFYADQGDDNADKWRMAAATDESAFRLYNFNDGAWETSIKALGSGAVELYHDNTKRIETSSSGATITGGLTFASAPAKAIALADNKRIYFGDGDDMWIGSNGSNGEVSGSLWLYNHLYLYDNVRLRIGHGQDLELYHNATDSYIDNNTGSLYIDSASNIILRSGGSTERIRIDNLGKITHSANGGDNQYISKRTGVAGSNGDYFFYLFAKNNGDTNVGSIGIVRDTANDDSRIVLHTRNSGGSNQERLRIDSSGNVSIGGGNNTIPKKLWIYDGSNDPYVRIQRGSTGSVIMGGYEVASSNGSNNVLSTMLTIATGNSGTTGATIFQVRDQANNYEVVRLCSQAQGSIQGNRMLVNGNTVCVFGSPHGTSGAQARNSNTTTYNTVYEHSNSAYRTVDNGMFGGTFVVGGNASYWYPVWFSLPTNSPPQELWVNKYVHNYATWDGTLFFRASLSGTGYGAYTVQHRVHYYASSSKEFIGKIIYTSHNNAWLVLWMLGGGRSYGWGTIGGNGINVNVGDDGNTHNLGPGNSSEGHITSNLTINQGYEQAMSTSGMHQQSDGW